MFVYIDVFISIYKKTSLFILHITANTLSSIVSIRQFLFSRIPGDVRSNPASLPHLRAEIWFLSNNFANKEIDFKASIPLTGFHAACLL